jgi:hypothetical protein
MSQTLWGKQKGPFAAPPEWTKQRSPWAYLPIWLFLPLTIVTIVFALPSLTAFYTCSDGGGGAACVGTALPPVSGGTHGDIAIFTGWMFLIALVLGVFAALRMKRGPVWLCWTLAAIGFGLAIVAFLMLTGTVPTPVGEVIQT